MSEFKVHLEKSNRSYSFGEARPRKFARDAISAGVDADALLDRLNKIRLQSAPIEAITDIIQKFESMSPDEALKAHGQITTETYVSVSNGQTDMIDKADLAEHIDSGILEQTMAFATSRGQADRVQNLSVTMIDERTATVIYQVRTGDFVGQSSATVIDDGEGWKIAVHAGHPYTQPD